MRTLRQIVAVLLLVAWLPAVNVCALTTAFPSGGVDPCCETESSAPVPTDTCADCSTLENGLPLSALAPLLVPTAEREVDAWLTALLATFAAEAASNSLLFEHSGIPPEPPLWHFVARTGAPARGPSFA